MGKDKYQKIIWTYKTINGESIFGSGDIKVAADMTTTVYDPQNIAGDAFSMDNMTETATAKILTDTERINIGNNTSKVSFPEAPTDGSEYVRKNGAWAVVSGGGGGGSEVNDLTASVTWANVPDANITQSSVTQHQAAISITESQITDLQTYKTKHKYMVPVWAEENAGLGASNTYEWAFGAGANTPNDGGLTVYVPTGYTCKVVAMSLRVGGGTATVELVKNGTVQGANCNVVLSSGQSATNDSFTPLSLANNDYINFRTTSSSGTSGPCVVTAWLEYNEI